MGLVKISFGRVSQEYLAIVSFRTNERQLIPSHPLPRLFVSISKIRPDEDLLCFIA